MQFFLDAIFPPSMYLKVWSTQALPWKASISSIKTKQKRWTLLSCGLLITCAPTEMRIKLMQQMVPYSHPVLKLLKIRLRNIIKLRTMPWYEEKSQNNPFSIDESSILYAQQLNSGVILIPSCKINPLKHGIDNCFVQKLQFWPFFSLYAY